MRKKIMLLIIPIIILFICMIIYFKLIRRNDIVFTQDVNVVPTMLDNIVSDTIWCGTFQLVWNDMKNEVVKKDIIFNPQIDIVNNLNKEEFTEKMISDKYYFKIYGLKSHELKRIIEEGIKTKFNKKSDILNGFNWDKGSPNEDINEYFFYSMLYREFEYKYKFNRLDNNLFGEYKNVQYFGISKDTGENVRNQITILFYNNNNDFALSISTKNNDEIIFYKNPQGNTFKEIYNNIIVQSNEYKGSRNISSSDRFKAPYVNLNIKREYKELEDNGFTASDGKNYKIDKAIQSITFEMDEIGGKVKSEAAVDMTKISIMPSNDYKILEIDNTFALFLKEKEQDVPYFAAKIEDITKYQ